MLSILHLKFPPRRAFCVTGTRASKIFFARRRVSVSRFASDAMRRVPDTPQPCLGSCARHPGADGGEEGVEAVECEGAVGEEEREERVEEADEERRRRAGRVRVEGGEQHGGVGEAAELGEGEGGER